MAEEFKKPSAGPGVRGGRFRKDLKFRAPESTAVSVVELEAKTEAAKGFRAAENRELVEGFLGHLADMGRSVHYLSNHRCFLNRLARWLGRPLPTIRCLDIEAWVAERRRSLSPKSLVHQLGMMRRFYRWLDPASPILPVVEVHILGLRRGVVE